MTNEQIKSLEATLATGKLLQSKVDVAKACHKVFADAKYTVYITSNGTVGMQDEKGSGIFACPLSKAEGFAGAFHEFALSFFATQIERNQKAFEEYNI